MTRKLVQGIVSDRSRHVIHVVRVLEDILDLAEIHEITDRMCARVLARHGDQTPNAAQPALNTSIFRFVAIAASRYRMLPQSIHVGASSTTASTDRDVRFGSKADIAHRPDGYTGSDESQLALHGASSGGAAMIA